MRVLLEPARAGGVRPKRSRPQAAPSPHAASRLAWSPSTSRPICRSAHSASRPCRRSFRTAARRRPLAERASREIVIDRGSARLRAFVQYLAPPPHLLVCGAGPDARARRGGGSCDGLARDGGGSSPGLCGPAAISGRERHARRCAARSATRSIVARCQAAVVMSHHLASDVAYLRALASAGLPDYVGIARAGRAATAHRATSSGRVAEALQSRLRGPVGIDIGAVIPEGHRSRHRQPDARVAGRPSRSMSATSRDRRLDPSRERRSFTPSSVECRPMGWYPSIQQQAERGR